MAIEFVYDQETDLAIFTLTGNFNLEEWLNTAATGRFTPALIEIMDLRRCNLNTMRSMDLARLTRYLGSAMDRGRLIPGKTAILVMEDGPPRYNPAYRLFYSFSIFARENKLPREFKLFTSVKHALDWIDNQQLSEKYAHTLLSETSDHGADVTLSA